MITDRELRGLPLGFHTIGEGQAEGLKLRVKASKDGDGVTRQFVFRYKWQYPQGLKQHNLGLGGYPKTSLKRARELAKELRGYLTEKPKRNPKEVWEAVAKERRRVLMQDWANHLMGKDKPKVIQFPKAEKG